MECPKCSFEQSDQQTECLRCGVIFDKYRRRQENMPKTEPSAAVHAEPALSPGEIIKELLFCVKPETNPLIFGGRALFFLVIFPEAAAVLVQNDDFGCSTARMRPSTDR